MKTIFIFLFFFNFTILHSVEIKFEKLINNLDKPWSFSFIDHENIIFTEKLGRLYTLNLKTFCFRGWTRRFARCFKS